MSPVLLLTHFPQQKEPNATRWALFSLLSRTDAPSPLEKKSGGEVIPQHLQHQPLYRREQVIRPLFRVVLAQKRNQLARFE